MTRSSLAIRRSGLAFAATLWTVASVSAAAPQTPERTLRAFVASVNARQPDCSLLLDDQVELFAVEPPTSTEPPTADQRLASCADIIKRNLGEPARLIRTTVVSVVVAERADALVRLRVHVRHHYRSHDEDQRITVWMAVEAGRWKLATDSLLLPPMGNLVPESLRRWPAYRRWLAGEAADHRADLVQQRALVRRLTRPVASQLLDCDGRLSQVTDPSQDVSWLMYHGAPVTDPSLPTIDMLAASLRSQAGQFCWEVRFARPPGPRYQIHVSVWRHSRTRNPRKVGPLVFFQEIGISVNNGTALARDEEAGFVPVEVSQTADIVRLKLTRAVLFRPSGPSDGRHPFTWAIDSAEDAPSAARPTRKHVSWWDDLPGPTHHP